MKTRIASSGDLRWLIFWCPGCDEAHSVPIVGPNAWSWNKMRETPSLSPSLLVHNDTAKRRCHSYVIDGRIKYLDDTMHALAGQTVNIPEWPYAEGTYGGIDPE